MLNADDDGGTPSAQIWTSSRHVLRVFDDSAHAHALMRPHMYPKYEEVLVNHEIR